MNSNEILSKLKEYIEIEVKKCRKRSIAIQDFSRIAAFRDVLHKIIELENK